MTSSQAIAGLCLECGLCCNGVLFRDVELQEGDNIANLLHHGLPVKTAPGTKEPVNRLPQPCNALCDNLRCRVYAQRPARCREFECAILQNVLAGKLPVEAALRKIHRARTKVRTTERLLCNLGEQRSDLPLKKRFRRVQLRLEKEGCDPDAADTFAKLSESYHALGLDLAAHFYPDQSGSDSSPSQKGCG